MTSRDEVCSFWEQNPVGKNCKQGQFWKMLDKHFVVKEIYLHYFPARALLFRLPVALHRWLDKQLGFMIYATLHKPCVD